MKTIEERIKDESKDKNPKPMKYIDAERLLAEIERRIEDINIECQKSKKPQYTLFGKINGLVQTLNIVRSLQHEQPEDAVVVARTFLDVLSKTPYNNKPITDAQVIVRQLLLFFENPKEYNPDAIVEQPDVDLVAELKHHLATTPKEQLEKEWKELEHWTNIGPTVQEFLYGKQPEIDLEKEITPSLVENMLCEFGVQSIDDMDSENLAEFARHFWNKGYNARKEK